MGLDDGGSISPYIDVNAPVPAGMRDEELTTTVDSDVSQAEVFPWSLRGEAGPQSTLSTLRYPNRRWLVSRYYPSSARAGEFATAFEPTPRQLAAMLHQAGLAP